MLASISIALAVGQYVFETPLKFPRISFLFHPLTISGLILIASVLFVRSFRPDIAKRRWIFIVLLLFLLITSAFLGVQILQLTQSHEAALPQPRYQGRLDLDTYCDAQFGGRYELMDRPTCILKDSVMVIEIANLCFEKYGSIRYRIDPQSLAYVCDTSLIPADH